MNRKHIAKLQSYVSVLEGLKNKIRQAQYKAVLKLFYFVRR